METFWYSARQRALLESLGIPSMFVEVNGEWKQYTVKCEGSGMPHVWPDFVEVGHGDYLPTKQDAVGLAVPSI